MEEQIVEHDLLDQEEESEEVDTYAVEIDPEEFSEGFVKEEIDEHEDVQDDESRRVCEYCGKKFATLAGLKRHLLIHTGEKPFACESCGKAFCDASNLKNHMLIHQNLKPYQCAVCNKEFRTSSNLKVHMVTHSKERPYLCEECGKSFGDKRILKIHVDMVHRKSRPYACAICGKTYPTSSECKRHSYIHTNDVRSECNLCHRKFMDDNYLQQHIKKHHTGLPSEKLHVCNVCGKVFYMLSHLSRHKVIHMEESEKFHCPTCGKGFYRLYHMQRHAVVHVHAQQQLVCPECGKKFHTTGRYERHVRAHAGLLPESKLSGVKLSADTIVVQVAADLGDGVLKCGACDLTFEEVEDLAAHLITHTDDEQVYSSCSYSCELCGKTFIKEGNWKLHMDRHNGESHHVCQVCGREFTTDGRLQRHIRSQKHVLMAPNVARKFKVA